MSTRCGKQHPDRPGVQCDRIYGHGRDVIGTRVPLQVSPVVEGFLVLALDDLRSGLDPAPLIDAALAALRFEESDDHQDDLDELAVWLSEELEDRDPGK